METRRCFCDPPPSSSLLSRSLECGSPPNAPSQSLPQKLVGPDCSASRAPFKHLTSRYLSFGAPMSPYSTTAESSAPRSSQSHQSPSCVSGSASRTCRELRLSLWLSTLLVGESHLGVYSLKVLPLCRLCKVSSHQNLITVPSKYQ
jgi:hypothetical protein